MIHPRKLEERRSIVRHYADSQLRWSAIWGEAPEERAACFDEALRRGQALNERQCLALALRLHIGGCEVCSGPDDGCEIGQKLESICIDGLGFDPYRLCAADGRVVSTRSEEEEQR